MISIISIPMFGEFVIDSMLKNWTTAQKENND